MQVLQTGIQRQQSTSSAFLCLSSQIVGLQSLEQLAVIIFSLKHAYFFAHTTSNMLNLLLPLFTDDGSLHLLRETAVFQNSAVGLYMKRRKYDMLPDEIVSSRPTNIPVKIVKC